MINNKLIIVDVKLIIHDDDFPYTTGRSGIVVTRLPAAREGLGSNRTKVCVFTKITALGTGCTLSLLQC